LPLGGLGQLSTRTGALRRPASGVKFSGVILPILEYPDPRLREVAKPVASVTDEIKKLVDDMAETMYAAPGCGLAATQVGVDKRVFVIDIATEDEPSNLVVFINAEIVELTGTQTWNEGCLSFPGVSEEIKRAERVRVRALDREGKPFELEAEGLLAVAIQHENDHLNGVLMIDKLSALKKRMMSRKLSKAAAAV
jgi:peptide deformylase